MYFKYIEYCMDKSVVKKNYTGYGEFLLGWWHTGALIVNKLSPPTFFLVIRWMIIKQMKIAGGILWKEYKFWYQYL